LPQSPQPPALAAAAYSMTMDCLPFNIGSDIPIDGGFQSLQ
jgi:hypothetical protein